MAEAASNMIRMKQWMIERLLVRRLRSQGFEFDATMFIRNRPGGFGRRR